MAWVNYREVRDRFGHIDAQLVRAEARVSPEGAEASITVRFYPWWEHPAYISARNAGDSWGFSDTEARRRDVTVQAVAPCAVRISRRAEVVDWGFSDEHPLLWEFGELVTVYVNGPFRVDELTQRLLDQQMPFVTRSHLQRYLDPSWLPVSSRGITFPAQLFDPITHILSQMNVPTLRRSPPEVPGLVAFLIDEDDYIVAEDFLVDVPEFRHEPEWFKPGSAEGAG